MSDPIPINLAAIQARQSQQLAKAAIARQDESEDSFTEQVEQGFNPASSEREQGRFNRFRSLESRKKTTETQEQKIQAVDAKAEEDLANNYSRRNPELPPDRLRQLKDSLNPRQTAEEILQEVEKTFSDPTLADEVLEYLEKGTKGELQGNVRRARALLNELKGREVIAGRNVDSAAKSFHKKGVGKNPTELRDLYRDITGNQRNHNVLFAELSKLYSYDELKLVIAYLLQALSYDMKSKGPSIQQPELMRLMTETRNLQSILWIYLFFKSRMKMIRGLYSRYGIDHSDELSFELLATAFIQIVEERYPSILKLIKIADKIGVVDNLEKVIIFSQYRDAIRQLSPRVYKSMRHRQDLLLVILETLEELEEQEEEEEE